MSAMTTGPLSLRECLGGAWLETALLKAGWKKTPALRMPEVGKAT